MPRTTTTSHVILGLLALRPEWTTWELAKQVKRNAGFFWPRAESRIYAELRNLVGRGLASSRHSAVGRRPRTIYRITKAGSAELRRWLATPPRPTHLESDPLLRVFLGLGSTQTDLLTAIHQVRHDAEAILEVGRLVSREYLEGTAPFQDQVQVRALVLVFLSEHAMALQHWADVAEDAIRSWERLDRPERDAAASRLIAHQLEKIGGGPPNRSAR